MPKMHKDKIDLEVSDVEEMIKEQFPQWSDLSIKRIQSFGTVNSIYKLGEKYSIRIPKTYSGVEQLEKERKWLSKLSKESGKEEELGL